jgi:hypothetical protein
MSENKQKPQNRLPAPFNAINSEREYEERVL